MNELQSQTKMTLLEQAEQLNNLAKQLNVQSDTKQGELSAYVEQLDTKIKQYEKKYGVQLNKDNLHEEKEKVMKETEEKVKLMTDVISAINKGDIDSANRLLGIEVKQQVVDTIDMRSIAESTVQEEVQQSIVHNQVIPNTVHSQTPAQEPTIVGAKELGVNTDIGGSQSIEEKLFNTKPINTRIPSTTVEKPAIPTIPVMPTLSDDDGYDEYDDNGSLSTPPKINTDEATELYKKATDFSQFIQDAIGK